MSSTLTRRSVLSLSTGALVASTLPALALRGAIEYTPQRLAQLQASGEPVLLDFSAKWCGTCRTQARVIERLVDANPAYRMINLVRVDWDQHKNGDLRKSLAVPRRSTLIMMKGDRELARVVAQTSETAIKALLDKGV